MTDRPIALVTGARRGIGRAIAVALAAHDFDLVVADLEVGDELGETRRLAEQAGANVIARRLDVAAIEDHDAFLSEVESALGPLSCLVNNAGVSVLVRSDLLDVGAASFDRCVNVNLRGTFFLMQAFARRLIARPPAGAYRSIVTITSSNVHAVSTNRGEYCVSKAGLSMASQLFAVRLANEGVGVFEVQPGIIASDMTAPVKAKYDAAIEAGLTAMRRWGTPEDVATVVSAMATGKLPYTVGLAVAVDGGLLTPRF